MFLNLEKDLLLFMELELAILLCARVLFTSIDSYWRVTRFVQSYSIIIYINFHI